MKNTKTFDVTCTCMAVYTSTIEVPENYTLEQAVAYAKEHIDEIPIDSDLDYICGSDELDEDNCGFSES